MRRADGPTRRVPSTYKDKPTTSESGSYSVDYFLGSFSKVVLLVCVGHTDRAHGIRDNRFFFFYLKI